MANLRDMSLEELAVVSAQEGSQQQRWVAAELQRRQMLIAIEASQAQKEAAQAAKDTAEHARRNVDYVFWTFVAIAVTAGISAACTALLAVLALLTYWNS